MQLIYLSKTTFCHNSLDMIQHDKNMAKIQDFMHSQPRNSSTVRIAAEAMTASFLYIDARDHNYIIGAPINQQYLAQSTITCFSDNGGNQL